MVHGAQYLTINGSWGILIVCDLACSGLCASDVLGGTVRSRNLNVLSGLKPEKHNMVSLVTRATYR